MLFTLSIATFIYVVTTYMKNAQKPVIISQRRMSTTLAPPPRDFDLRISPIGTTYIRVNNPPNIRTTNNMAKKASSRASPTLRPV